jgi:hypothetical protein
MSKNLFESIELMLKRFYNLKERAISKISIDSFYDAGPEILVNFINADAMDAKSIWPIYKGAIRFMADLKEWIVTSKYGCPEEKLNDIKFLSFKEFSKDYWPCMSEPVNIFQEYILKILDSDNIDNAFHNMLESSEDWLTLYIEDEERAEDDQIEEIHIPPARFIITAKSKTKLSVDNSSPYDIDILVGGTDGFTWLSVIRGSILSSYQKGDRIRRCTAPDCRRFFIVDKRNPGHIYHTVRCQNRHYKQKRNKKGSD